MIFDNKTDFFFSIIIRIFYNSFKVFDDMKNIMKSFKGQLWNVFRNFLWTQKSK